MIRGERDAARPLADLDRGHDAGRDGIDDREIAADLVGDEQKRPRPRRRRARERSDTAGSDAGQTHAAQDCRSRHRFTTSLTRRSVRSPSTRFTLWALGLGLRLLRPRAYSGIACSVRPVARNSIADATKPAASSVTVMPSSPSSPRTSHGCRTWARRTNLPRRFSSPI